MELPTELRKPLASQLKQVRTIEQKRGDGTDEFTINRSYNEYDDALLGVSTFLDYVKQESKSKVVVDIGTGKGLGFAEIMEFLGEGLTPIGVGLTYNPEMKRYLGDGHIRITPVERLKGFANESVGAVLGVHSLQYSAFPDQAVLRLDEILEPGGLIKSAFANIDKDMDPDDQEFVKKYQFKSAKVFADLLRKKGYETLVHGGLNEANEVLIARKPGGKSSTLLSEILETDYQDLLSYHKVINASLEELHK